MTTTLAFILLALLTACIDISLAQPDSTTLAASPVDAGPVTLGSGAAQIPLTTARESQTIGPGASLTSRLKAATSGTQQVYLRFAEVTAQAMPGVTYNVYVNLPPDAAPQGVDDPHYAGTLNFFNVRPTPATELALNATDTIQRLLARDAIGTALTVTIIPAGQPQADARPRIARVLLSTR